MLPFYAVDTKNFCIQVKSGHDHLKEKKKIKPTLKASKS